MCSKLFHLEKHYNFDRVEHDLYIKLKAVISSPLKDVVSKFVGTRKRPYSATNFYSMVSIYNC